LHLPGIVLPISRWGVPLGASSKLYVYEPGGTTPRATYTASDLLTPNAHPVVADSAGLFPPVYIDSTLGYKVVLKTSAGVEIFSQDNAYVAPDATIAALVCNGRLTLTTGVSVTTADVTAATTLYFTPHEGNRIGLYDGSAWNLRTFTEKSIAVPATTSQMYDVFVYDNAGTPTLELLAWTNDTTRATALTTQDGVLVKTGAATRRYVGSFRTTGVSGQAEDSAAKRHVWNYYNRKRRTLRVHDATDSWTYTTAAYRQANGSAANQVDVVVGVAEVDLDLEARAFVSNDTGGNIVAAVNIGEDGITPFSGADVQTLTQVLATAARGYHASARVRRYPSVGRHYYTWLEYSDAVGVTTWYGDSALPTLVSSGMLGSIEG
jgi:hypothetical protein